MYNIPTLAKEAPVVIAMIASDWEDSKPVQIILNQQPIPRDDHLSGFVHGATSRLDASSDDLRDIMDCFIELSATSSRNAKLACALTRRHGGAFELLLGGHTPIQESTVQHMERVWDDLRQLSTIDAPANSKSLTEAIRDAQTVLERRLLEFSISDVYQSFSAESMVLDELEAEWDKNESSLRTDSRYTDPGFLSWMKELKDSLLKLVRSCKNKLQPLSTIPCKDQPPTYWSDILTDMAEILRMTEVTLHPNARANVARFDLAIDDVYDGLRTSLTKLTSFATCCKTLRQHARATGSAQNFMQSLTVTKIDPTPCQNMIWPSKNEEWISLRSHIQKENNHKAVKTINIGGHSTPPTSTHYIVHPELALVEFLMNIINSANRPAEIYNYIAVSGLSCSACLLWLRAYNLMNPAEGFAVRGSDHTWPRNWVMPAFKKEQINPKVLESAVKVYLHVGVKNHVLEREIARD